MEKYLQHVLIAVSFSAFAVGGSMSSEQSFDISACQQPYHHAKTTDHFWLNPEEQVIVNKQLQDLMQSEDPQLAAAAKVLLDIEK